MAAAATGTHTFLFTDIEGSTRRWQEHATAMRAALAAHDSAVGDVVQEFGGRLFKHTGDGACAVFSSAGAAVDAAVALQRRLAAIDFEAVGGLAVRIGIHTGEAEERADDFFGPALNRTARLMGLAHGGQVLVSDATAALLGERPATGLELADLGEHSLRDIARPERVHQVVADGLRRQFPPLRTTSLSGARIPESRTPFIGREQELDELLSLLGRRRLVTLVGVGGTGKTRLALEAARRAAPTFPGGAVFADLSSITDGGLVFAALAAALGLPSADVGGLSTSDAVVELIGDRRLLLVVDNCEQIVDGCAEAVDRLLEECTSLVILATSREALDVEGEHSWPVASMSMPSGEADAASSEAVQLFVERARAAAGTFELTLEHVRPVVEICRRLDGIPLALELAASRVSHMQPAEIASRLDDRFHLLVGGRRRRAQRQQTLEAALDWSYDLLPPAEQALLRRLSVFAGSFTAEAAAAVCLEQGGSTIVDLLGSLVAKSLVAHLASDGASTRYRLLETMRLYAAQKLLDAGEAEQFRDRHRDHFLAWIESFPLDQTLVTYPVIDLLAPELENLRAALDWSESRRRLDLAQRLALRMTGTWAEGSQHEEGMARLQALADADLPEAERAECLALVSFLAMYGGSFDEMRDAARSSLALDSRGRCAPVAHQFDVLYMVFDQLDTEEIHRRHDEARRLAHEHGLPLFAAMATAMEVHFWASEGQYDKVATFDVDVPVGPTYSTFVYLMAAVFTAVVDGRAEDALAAAELQEHVSESLAYSHLFRGVCLAELGRLEEAAKSITEAAREFVDMPTPLSVHDCLISFAGLALAEGDPARATTLLEAVWASRAMASYRSPASWVLSRHYRYRAKDRLEPDVWEQARARGRELDTVSFLRAEVARYS
jgi:predicted ATPase/class 3 adenylate cyclase